MVAVDPIRIGIRQLPESRLRAPVATVRRVLRLCLLQVRPLRRSPARIPPSRRRDRNPCRATARKTEIHNAIRGRPGSARIQRLFGRARREARQRRQDRHVTAPETPEASSPTAPVETIRKALIGYRIMAWTTGVWLIALCYEMVLKYLVHVDNPPNWIAIVHGWVYFVYLIFTANLAVKV